MDQDKKKNTLIIVWSLAALVLAALLSWFGYQVMTYATHHDKQYKFSVTYPKAWKKMENFYGAPVAFIRPKKTALDTFEVNVNISVQEVPDHLATMATFSETITQQMTAVFDKNIVVLEDKDIRFANRDGHMLKIESAKPNDAVMLFVWTMKGPFAYIFTFSAQRAQYKEEWSVVKKMMDSFELK